MILAVGQAVELHRKGVVCYTARVLRVSVRYTGYVLHDVRHLDGRPVKPTGDRFESLLLRANYRTGIIASEHGLSGELTARPVVT